MTTKNLKSSGNSHLEKKQFIEITKGDLPLHCPLDSMSLWNSHPRVYLPIEKSGKVLCPYCGTEYELKDEE